MAAGAGESERRPLKNDEDVWFEIDDLAIQARQIAPDAVVKATYTAGPTFLEQAGIPSLLWVAICNSALNDGPKVEMEHAASAIVPLALAWLRNHDLATSGTGIEIAFADFHEAGPFSMQNTLESIRFSIDADGTLSAIRSADDPFRQLRYRLSGRELP